MIMFSVIIPLYNKVDTIKRAIRSVWNQTFADYELIVVNDGSTDDSLSIVTNLSYENPIVIIDQKNGGVSSARYLCGMSLRYWVLHVVLPLFLIACLSGLSGYAVVTSLSPSLVRCLGTGLASVFVLISGSMYIICDKEEKAYIVGAFSRVVSKFKAGHICLAQKK